MSNIIQFPLQEPLLQPEPSQSLQHEQEPEIYVNDAALPDELWHSVDIALMAADPMGELLFKPVIEKNWGGQWVSWIDGTFSTLVAPHLVRAREAAELGVLELSAADLDFDEQLLDDPARERSITAGAHLMNRHDGAVHLKHVEKLRRQIAVETCKGHAVSIFALHCALFNVPAAPMVVAYALFEFRCAQKATIWPKVDRPRVAFEQMTPNLSRRLQSWLRNGTNNTFQPRAVE